MRNVLPVSLIMGAIAGLLVGGFLNVFNVPVMEWAISLEEAAAESGGRRRQRSGGSGGHLQYPWECSVSDLVAGLAVLGVLYRRNFHRTVSLGTPGCAGLEYVGLGRYRRVCWASGRYPFSPRLSIP